VIGKPEPVFPFIHKEQQNEFYNSYDADEDQSIGNLA
jgi:hypothetical protein